MLSKRFPFSFKFAHISLACAGLMWVLPFLYYHHTYPLTTFYQEWGAALLGLCALSLLLSARYWQAPQVPRSVSLPIGLLLLLVLQFLLGMIEHYDRVMLLSLYFLYAALLVMLGQRLRQELGLPAVATVLAGFLLAGAELNTLAGLVQHYRWDVWLNQMVTAKVSHAVYGNTAQPNHYADYLALGLLSLGLLHVRFRWRMWQTALLAAPMLFVLVLSGSRSSWLYLLLVAGLGYLWQRRERSLRPLWHYGLALLAGFVLMHWLVQLPWLQGASGSVTTAERLFGDNASGGIRLYLWREAALIFAGNPLLGAGLGQFAWEHLQLAPQLREPGITGLYNNAHNLVMQLAAETGLVGLAVLFGAAGVWLWQAWRGERDLYHWWGYGVLGVLAIHSMLEYPLWYAYFIGVAALLLGLFDTSGFRLELRRLGRLALALILVLAALSLARLHQDYLSLGQALVLRAAPDAGQGQMQRAHEMLLEVHRSPLLSSYAEMYIAGGLEPSTDHLDDKLELNGRALRFIPTAAPAYHQALLLALDGQQEPARRAMEQAIWSYPERFAVMRGELDELARKEPERVTPLLEFAVRTYEEYRSAAVPGK